MKRQFLARQREGARYRTLLMENFERRLLLAGDTWTPEPSDLDSIVNETPAVVAPADYPLGIYYLDPQSPDGEPTFVRLDEFLPLNRNINLGWSSEWIDEPLLANREQVRRAWIDNPYTQAPQDNSSASETPATTVDVHEPINDTALDDFTLPHSYESLPKYHLEPIGIVEPISQLAQRELDQGWSDSWNSTLRFSTTVLNAQPPTTELSKDRFEFGKSTSFVLHAYGETEIPRITLHEPVPVDNVDPDPVERREPITNLTPDPIDIANVPPGPTFQTHAAPPFGATGTSVTQVGDTPLSVSAFTTNSHQYDDSIYSLESHEMGPFVRSSVSGPEVGPQISSMIQVEENKSDSDAAPTAEPHLTMADADGRTHYVQRPDSVASFIDAEGKTDSRLNRQLPERKIVYAVSQSRGSESQASRMHRSAIDTVRQEFAQAVAEAVSTRVEATKMNEQIRLRFHAIGNLRPSIAAEPQVASQAAASDVGAFSLSTPNESTTEESSNRERNFDSVANSVSNAFRFSTPLALLAIPLLFCRRYWQSPETEIGPREMRVPRELPKSPSTRKRSLIKNILCERGAARA